MRINRRSNFNATRSETAGHSTRWTAGPQDTGPRTGRPCDRTPRRSHARAVWRGVAAFAAVTVVAAVLPAAAQAASVSFAGGALTYNAAAGEQNYVGLRAGSDASDCGTRPAPCFVVSEGFYLEITSFPADRCSRDANLSPTYVECDMPTSVIVNLGDGNDYHGDWEGPSQINGGSGDDQIIARGGNDSVSGGSGEDSISGDAGDDTLDGGDGNDYLEGNGIATFGDMPTAGSDVYVGGPGTDIVDYGARSEQLSVSLDGARNDGAAGEADDVGADVERVRGGLADDVLLGNATRNILDGSHGNDTLRGGGGEDDLMAGEGDDRLSGEDGQDYLQGANGDDELDGGAGVDTFNGDGDGHCAACGVGADRIFARDGLTEEIRCGRGEDTAILDPTDKTDQECERVDNSRSGSGSVASDGQRQPGTSAGQAATPARCKNLAGTRKQACISEAKALARCNRLKASRKRACVNKARALAKCNRLKGHKKKACVRKVNRKFSGRPKR